MKFYNSLTKKVEEFQPVKKGEVGLYTCGPTVYDHVHIGNLRTYIFEDTLRRVLRSDGYDVRHVMNITDIEDKIFKRSKEQYPNEPVSTSYKKLTHHYEDVFLDEVVKVGIDLTESKIIRATDAIEDMQTIIRAVPNKYISDDGVYFDISEFPGYGVFVRLDQTHEHHRIDNDEYDKEHVADFALWKKAKADEPAWDFELEGKNLRGRPGWHIECSAMSTKYLGQPFDIHTGGVDLKFPHHENEIAQSTAAASKKLANYWIHGEHLLVDGKKMSKSLKNFYTLDDLESMNVEPLAFRLLVLQSHYRSQLNLSQKSLAAASTFLKKLYELADRVFQTNEPGAYFDFKTPLEQIKSALNNDIDTPGAIAVLAKLADQATMSALNTDDLNTALSELESLFSLGLVNRQDITAEQKVLIVKRSEARATNNFEASDKLRDQLAKQGLGLNDTSTGTFWYRTT